METCPDHESLIRQCYHLASTSVGRGNHPFGALLWREGGVFMEAENTVLTGCDITAHAELNLVRKVSASVAPGALADAILYSSAEPCVMCCGAIYWSGLRRVVFGVSAPSLASVTGGHYVIESREIYARLKPGIEVMGPVLESEGLAEHRRFWPGC
jgi:tRNA(Arg) A34 adenosine deaminase TadA